MKAWTTASRRGSIAVEKDIGVAQSVVSDGLARAALRAVAGPDLPFGCA